MATIGYPAQLRFNLDSKVKIFTDVESPVLLLLSPLFLLSNFPASVLPRHSETAGK